MEHAVFVCANGIDIECLKLARGHWCSTIGPLVCASLSAAAPVPVSTPYLAPSVLPNNPLIPLQTTLSFPAPERHHGCSSHVHVPVKIETNFLSHFS